MSSLSSVLLKNEWEMIAINCRYGGNIYVFVGPHIGLLSRMDDYLNGDDIAGTSMQFYLADEGSWLPVGYGKTYDDATKMLEDKLNVYSDEKKWVNSIFTFYDWFVNYFRKVNGYSLESELDKANSPLLFSSYTENGELPCEE